ncbi:MAG TPA: HAD hydrolase family protein [Ktedonobacteraceae bacterium]|nr:HAD hydrolase family protein [Ktedonobacteraceae bacterium]
MDISIKPTWEAKIFAFDVDGTIAHKGRLLPEAKKLFHYLASKQRILLLVTMRTWFEVLPIITELAVPIQTVCFGGSVLVDSARQVLWSDSASLPREAIEQIHATCGEFIAESIFDWSCSAPILYPFAKCALGLPSSGERSWPPDFPVRRLVTLSRYMRQDFSIMIPNTCVITRPPNLPITKIECRGIAKGEGLARFAALMGWDLSNAVSVGDDEADISMFQQTESSITFTSAPAIVRKAARLHIGSIDDIFRLF